MQQNSIQGLHSVLNGNCAISASFEKLTMFFFFEALPRDIVSFLWEFARWKKSQYFGTMKLLQPDREKMLLSEFEEG